MQCNGNYEFQKSSQMQAREIAPDRRGNCLFYFYFYCWKSILQVSTGYFHSMEGLRSFEQYLGSNEMPFTAWKHTERNRQRDRKKYVMIS